MSPGPLISIITPSYNQGRFIGDTIRSVAEQSYHNIEHIVVDGGSTDETMEVCRSWEHRSHFRWTSERDEGQVDAIRKGLSMASGDILTWLNSDDVYLDNEVIERIVNKFVDSPEIQVVTGGGRYLEEDGSPGAVISAPVDDLWKIRYCDVVLQPATFLKREVFDETPIDLSLHFAFDWDFFARAFEGRKVVAIPQLLAGYRMYGMNKTAAGGWKRLAELTEVTGRQLGTKSWQYRVLITCTWIDRQLDLRLPGALSALGRRGLYKNLSLLSSMSSQRIQT